jgi:hypothetical protein
MVSLVTFTPCCSSRASTRWPTNVVRSSASAITSPPRLANSLPSGCEIRPGRFVQQTQSQNVGDGEPGQPADLRGHYGAVDPRRAGREVAFVHPLDVGLLVVRTNGIPNPRDERIGLEGRAQATKRLGRGRPPTEQALQAAVGHVVDERGQRVATLLQVRAQEPEQVPHLPSVEGLLDAGGPLHLVVGHHEQHAGVAHVVRGEHEAEQRESQWILRREHLRRVELDHDDGGALGSRRCHRIIVAPASPPVAAGPCDRPSHGEIEVDLGKGDCLHLLREQKFPCAGCVQGQVDHALVVRGNLHAQLVQDADVPPPRLPGRPRRLAMQRW